MKRKMNYNRLFEKLFSQRSNSNNSQVAVALVAGLAAGAIISILFAPKKGSSMRNGIADKAKSLSSGMRDNFKIYKDKFMGNHSEDVVAAPEVPHFTHTVPKRRKSDIKTLITEAHEEANHADEPLN